MKISDETFDQMAALYRDGLSMKDLGKMHGVSRQAVSQRFKKFGIKRPAPQIPVFILDDLYPVDRTESLKRFSVYGAVQRAVRKGVLIRQPCEVCGEKKVQAHHDDYDKPLDVRWLCIAHHNEHHTALDKGKHSQTEREGMTPSQLRAICDSLNDDRGIGGQSLLAERLDWNPSTVRRKLAGTSKITYADELAVLAAVNMKRKAR